VSDFLVQAGSGCGGLDLDLALAARVTRSRMFSGSRVQTCGAVIFMCGHPHLLWRKADRVPESLAIKKGSLNRYVPVDILDINRATLTFDEVNRRIWHLAAVICSSLLPYYRFIRS
jgi:hypothetical protein